jgi:hypothetical protein
MRCGLDGHCQPEPCSAAGTCPGAEFDCIAGSCVRRACSSDGECGSERVCVQHACYDTLGYCQAL